jgi:hypothetical protein
MMTTSATSQNWKTSLAPTVENWENRIQKIENGIDEINPLVLGGAGGGGGVGTG